MPDNITIEVDGMVYSGWKSATVRRSLDSLCGSFTFTTYDRWSVKNKDWVLFPGKRCRVGIGSDTILEGYIDRIRPQIGAERHSVSVSGRDATADLVDCSTFGTWNNATIYKLAKAMAEPFGVNVRIDVDGGEPFTKFTAQPGDTVFNVLSRAAAKRGILLLSGRVGNLLLTNAGASWADDQIAIGRNVKSASAEYDHTDRFSVYKVQGQSKDAGSGWGEETISSSGEAKDEWVERYRPKTINARGVATPEDAERQAAWMANVHAARAFRASAELIGFRQTTGALWEVNRLVSVDMPDLRLQGDMLISSAEYTQSESGSVTRVELTILEAYEPEPAKTVRKNRSIGW
jgi:prophage tail gpP-like protein